MRIGYLLQVGEEIRQPPFNGPANHIRQIIENLCRQGHQVVVLFRWDGRIWKSEGLQEFEPIVVSRIDRGLLRLIERLVRRIQFELKLPYLGFFESLRFALACRQELIGCDLFYERLSWMTYGGTLASGWLRIPWIVEYNGDPMADLEAKGMAPRGLQRIFSVWLMKWSLQRASHVIATGEGWRRNCIRTWDVMPEKVTAVENGTELVYCLSREKLKAFRVDETGEQTIRLVYLGGFYPWHGITILLRALGRAFQERSNLRLTLIGSGDGFEEAQLLASELGLNDAVRFMGKMSAEEFAPILAEADIGLSPYCGWEEYSGLKIFDYKAAGLACIASGEDGQPVTLKHGQTGWIVAPCDEDALLGAILQLSEDPSLRRKIGQAARLDAEQFHSWEHTASRLEQIFMRYARQ